MGLRLGGAPSHDLQPVARRGAARAPASRRCAARSAGRAEAVAEKIRVELEQRGLLGEPVGVDIVELPVLRALEAAGINVVDGQALMQDVRMVKTPTRSRC